ncbi:hypothetical protein [Nocardioides lianchengensis]|uniref:Alpha/beta hydrolase family protein n=1 Tax=Nocardioides lianchengensis TaxID=1045774 RepID=A0A1G7A7K4_9ACTN|nr:hypothetical protein [Nocardioides lianchengensis]NYG13680.1 hypothetical protein [Nocardioides lianchengensis]SDE10908.1 hypothetical protein SAMN05421872_11517 [Nocardioides lianchengensis]
MTRMTTLIRRSLVAVLAAASLAAAPYPATGVGADRAPTSVRTFDYDLGDRALTVRGFHGFDRKGRLTRELAPLELTGRVYAPADAAGRRLPLVVIAHGLFWTCADEASGEVDGQWPCRGTRTAIRSDRGYDALGRDLAARGMVVVSVGANGVNAGELGEVADRARGTVVLRHLRMWRDLVERGTGPLVGAFRSSATGRPVRPDLRGAVDLRNVGLLGHSRGGRGVMWVAAAAHRQRLPEGVRIRAVFGLAAAGPPFLDRNFRRLQVTDVPLMTWAGTCDATGRDEYNQLAQRAGNRVNIGITVHGANHNNLNTRWAAGGGPGGEDDAGHPEGRPGRCTDGFSEETSRTLGPRAERRVQRTYAGAFFARYLQRDRSYDAVLAGRRHPVRDLTRVDVRRYRPAR